MPGYKTHMLVGLLCGAVVLFVASIIFPGKTSGSLVHGLGLGLSPFVAIISDIDIRTSIAFKVWASTFAVAAISFFVTLILASKGAIAFQFSTIHYVIAAFVSVIFLLSIFLKHRGIMHSYGMAALTSLPWSYYSPWLTLYAFIGYSSHIFIDKYWPD